MKALSFVVPGVARPQGSKKMIPHKHTGRPIMLDDNSNLKAWREAVAIMARSAVVRHDHWKILDGPVAVGLRFYLPRPASVPKRLRPFMIVKPDIDKITRAILDALTTAKVYTDDARVVELHIYKNYADDNPPGVFVTVEEAGTL